MKSFFTALALLMSASTYADLTIALTPGLTESRLQQLKEASGILKLTGEMTGADIILLGGTPLNASVLDLSEISIPASGVRHNAHRRGYPNAEGQIPDYAFFRCCVKEVILPRRAKPGKGIFAYAATERVVLPINATILPEHAFYKSNIQSVENTENITEIGKEAFAGSRIETLSFPSMTKCGDFAFAGMSELKEIFINGDAFVGQGALMDCPDLVAVKGGITAIPDFFVANSAIKQTDIPLNASVIGKYSFANTLARHITLGSDLQEVSTGAFKGMNKLEYIDANLCGSTLPHANGFSFDGIAVEKIKLYVADSTAQIWREDPEWGKFEIIEGIASAEMIALDPSGIAILLSGGNIKVTSDSIVNYIEIYDMSGTLIYTATPAATEYSISTDALGGCNVALVRASGRNGAKSAKILL